jgi:mannose-6-phosphate isomerase-like protein (cupin superfamily)
MPIIHRNYHALPGDDFTNWGLARFQKGATNVTEPHFHDCDEWVFMLEGKILMRSEGVECVVEPRDLQVTRKGDVHELIEVLEDCVYFWACGPLSGLKRPGHLDPALTRE